MSETYFSATVVTSDSIARIKGDADGYAYSLVYILEVVTKTILVSGIPMIPLFITSGLSTTLNVVSFKTGATPLQALT
jgi:hypothetical protein